MQICSEGSNYLNTSVTLCQLWPPLWSSGQSSWLQIRRPGFDFRQYQKIKVVGLDRGPLSLVSTTEELLNRKIEAPVYKIENTAVGIRHADHVAPSIRKSNHFANKRRSLCRYSSLAYSDHGVLFMPVIVLSVACWVISGLRLAQYVHLQSK
jgi:hypothetical protein